MVLHSRKTFKTSVTDKYTNASCNIYIPKTFCKTRVVFIVLFPAHQVEISFFYDVTSWLTQPIYRHVDGEENVQGRNHISKL